MTAYKALALQLTCPAVNDCPDRATARARMAATIHRTDGQIGASKRFIGPDTRLVVLPEYFLTGFPMGESLDQWRDKACLAPDDEFYARLGETARRHDVFLSGNAYETDDHFPGLYFQTSFVIDPAGELILRYRRLNSMFAPTPYDVLDEYVRIYGYAALFPVADTEIGRLACIASEEILYPEIARCLMAAGAEVFLHSSSEVGSPLLTQKNVAKLARATENMAYVVSANSAGIAGIAIPLNSTDGGSKVVDYEGQVRAEAGPGESMVANATIDLAALRAHRRRGGMANFIARQRFGLYAPTYAAGGFYPANAISERPGFRKQDFSGIQRRVIERLAGTKII